jgi:hypothetical protein
MPILRWPIGSTAAEGIPNLVLKDESSLLIDIAPHLEDFLAHLFGITAEVRARGAHHELAPLLRSSGSVQRKAASTYKAEAATFDGAAFEPRSNPLARRLSDNAANSRSRRRHALACG